MSRYFNAAIYAAKTEFLVWCLDFIGRATHPEVMTDVCLI